MFERKLKGGLGSRVWLLCLLTAALGIQPVPAARAAEERQNGAVASPAKVTPPGRRTWDFPEDGVTFDSQFSASRLSECTRQGPGEYRVVTAPENRPINQSAWFAFKVSASTPREIRVHLNCDGAPLRYRPKISVDGLRWLPLPAEAIEKGTDKNSATLRLEVGEEPLWVAAQEIVDGARLEAWSRTMERLPFVERSEIGRSVLGAPLYKLEITGAREPGFVVIVGRQHPPEVTGSLALMHFVETLVGDTPVARAFREEFSVLVVPLVNPDGVEQGHWRHNARGVDLNRDWEEFRQPETRVVRDQILALRDRGRVFLHLDFHSTYHDVFYTQADELPSTPAHFAARWVEGIRGRFPDYPAKTVVNHLPKSNTSHNWAYRTLGVPAITYEIGDNTDRTLLRQIADGAAQEMMTLLLEMK
ncbi:MAG: M14 family metallopeptidase, partial [Planctomycetota bacterium]